MNNIIFKTLLLKGEAGNDIQSVEKTATSGLVDTYTITLTDGSTHTFNVTNGKSIVSIEKTSSVGYVDTYTITYNDGSTDTFEITLATITVDDALSDSSTNPVQNKLITQNLNHLTNNTCVNLLNPTAQTQTINGVTFTNNGDGTYTVNGTASITTTLRACNVKAEVGQWLVGCPQGGSETKYQLGLLPDGTWEGWATQRDNGEGSLIQNVGDSETLDTVVIDIYKGYTANNLLFKPMLTTDLNATYDDYVPYTGDSGRLNEEVARLTPVQEQIVPSANIESGTTASQAYVVGDYLVYNGQLCKVISAIAQGDTLTVGTNIEVTTSGGEFKKINSDLSDSTVPEDITVVFGSSAFTNKRAFCKKIGKMIFYNISFTTGNVTYSTSTPFALLSHSSSDLPVDQSQTTQSQRGSLLHGTSFGIVNAGITTGDSRIAIYPGSTLQANENVYAFGFIMLR